LNGGDAGNIPESIATESNVHTGIVLQSIRGAILGEIQGKSINGRAARANLRGGGCGNPRTERGKIRIGSEWHINLEGYQSGILHGGRSTNSDNRVYARGNGIIVVLEGDERRERDLRCFSARHFGAKVGISNFVDEFLRLSSCGGGGDVLTQTCIMSPIL
jgi:hypothetical protein